MAGIYIHIPFCKQACHYCNFHFSTSIMLKNGFLQALLNEITLQKNFLTNEVVETIYFGGGTPSLLSADEITKILDAIHSNYAVAAETETTLEANPDDISFEKLTALKQAGINRLSIGVQSFFEEDLRWMNRAHNAAQAQESIELAYEAGFDNISIDLIFGTPTLPDSNWKNNVDRAIALNVKHLSCYSLTVEPKTPLEKLIRKGKLDGINTEDQARQFLLLIEWLSAAGYEQYEISNYSLPGMRSKHNSSYWQGKKYLGLGPSAHSFDGNSRQWNIANNAIYIRSLQQNIIPFESEILSPAQKLNEWIMTSLRIKEGLQFDAQARQLAYKMVELLKKKGARYQQQDLLTITENSLILTNKGKLYADGIAASLFFEEAEVRDDACAAGF